MMNRNYKLGLLGRDISYSLSPALFDEIFRREGLEGSSYVLIDREELEPFIKEVRTEGRWCGFNVTTPYKVTILPYLDRLDPLAEAAGAVNCVTYRHGLLTGYNTDVEGFVASLREEIEKGFPKPKSALILGTGGAADAVTVALRSMDIPSEKVSRSKGLTYDQLTPERVAAADLIVNATPLGSRKYPGERPPIPYEGLRAGQLLLDLTYVPEVTPFMEAGRAAGCRTANGMTMLRAQAAAAWEHFRR